MSLSRNSLYTEGAKRLFAYWNGLPKEGLIPDRSSFDPVAIRDLMRAVTLLEIWSLDRVEIRLAGTGVCEGMGFDPTGRNTLDLLAPETRDRYRNLIAAQIETPCGRWNVLTTRHAGGVISRAEVITLPMFYARAGHHMILSYFGTIDVVGYDVGGYQIMSYDDTRWIDIGAGVPDWS